MPQVTPSFTLPFTQFPGIDHEAARRIWRDFDAVAGALTPALTIFDAIIDPTVTASNAGTHIYKNLTDLNTNETWATTHTFRVGVRQQANVTITETVAGVNIQGKGDLALFGLGQPMEDATHNGWRWGTIFADDTQQVYYHNLSIGGFSTATIQNRGTIVLESCYIGTFLTIPIASGAPQNLFAKDCYISGNWGFSSGVGVNQTIWLLDTIVVGDLSFGNLITAHVQGGALGTAGAKTVTISGTSNAYIESDIESNLTISSSGANVVVVNTGVGINVTVSATTPNVSVTGEWLNVTFSGAPSSTALRQYKGSANSLDFTGPGQVIHTNHGTGAGTQVKLRGTGVQALVENQGGVGVQGLSLIDSQIMATFGVASTFLLDAGCVRVVAILSGTNQAGWGGTTNSGTNCRIITETSDTFVSSPPAAGIPPSLLMGALEAVQSGIQTYPPAAASTGATTAQLDAIRKDLVPADLVGPATGVDVYGGALQPDADRRKDLVPAELVGPASGIQTYPPTTTSGSGATAAQLDAIRKDLVPAEFIPAAGVQTYPTASNVAQDAAKDFNRNFMI